MSKIAEILKGINRDEIDYADGWWETNAGAAFGAQKLTEALVYETELLSRIAELERDAARYQKHCRNPQVAAWCGIDPNAIDVLIQLDKFIDSAIQGEKQ